MTKNSKEHTRAVSSGIKLLATMSRREVGDHLQYLKAGLSEPSLAMPAADRHEMIEELCVGLNTWADEIDAVRGDLRSLLRQLQDESWD